MKLLIDRNIERYAIICQTEYIDQTVKWGDQTFIVPSLKRKDKLPREDEKFIIANLPYLARLCKEAEQGDLEFYTSFELRMEKLRQKGTDDGYLRLNLMRNISFKHTISPVERTVTISSLENNFGTTEKEQMTFFREIKDSQFRSLIKHFPEKQIDDVFHLWTAETNNIDIFLTMDKKFANNAKQMKRHLNLNSRVLSPKNLCEELNFTAIELQELKNDTHPFS